MTTVVREALVLEPWRSTRHSIVVPKCLSVKSLAAGLWNWLVVGTSALCFSKPCCNWSAVSNDYDQAEPYQGWLPRHQVVLKFGADAFSVLLDLVKRAEFDSKWNAFQDMSQDSNSPISSRLRGQLTRFAVVMDILMSSRRRKFVHRKQVGLCIKLSPMMTISKKLQEFTRKQVASKQLEKDTIWGQ